MPLLWFIGAYAILIGFAEANTRAILPEPPPSVVHPQADRGNRRARRREAKLGL